MNANFGWSLPPGVTSDMIERAYGGGDAEPFGLIADRCACGSWLPQQPARGTRWDEQMENCPGDEYCEHGESRRHQYLAHADLIRLHRCRRCGRDSEHVA